MAAVTGQTTTTAVHNKNGHSYRPLLQRFTTRYRPYLWAVSATMLTYSFVKVYRIGELSSPRHLVVGNDNNKSPCCTTIATKDINLQQQQQKLQMQKAMVWLSLVVAVAGATYGQFSPSSSFRTQRLLSWTRQKGGFNNNNNNLTILTNTNSTMPTTGSSSTSPPRHGMTRLSFQVTGMKCQGCANQVHQAILQQSMRIQELVTTNHPTSGGPQTPTWAIQHVNVQPSTGRVLVDVRTHWNDSDSSSHPMSEASPTPLKELETQLGEAITQSGFPVTSSSSSSSFSQSK